MSRELSTKASFFFSGLSRYDDTELDISSKRWVLPLVIMVYFVSGSTTYGCCVTAMDRPSEERFFSTLNSKEVIFTTSVASSSVLQKTDYVTRQKPIVFAQDVVSFTTEGRKLLWLDQKGMIWEKNLSSDGLSIAVTQQPYVVEPETKYTIITNGSTHLLEEISNSVSSYLESPDKKKLAFVDNSRLIVFFFETKKQVLLGTLTQAPKSLSWLGNE